MLCRGTLCVYYIVYIKYYIYPKKGTDDTYNVGQAVKLTKALSRPSTIYNNIHMRARADYTYMLYMKHQNVVHTYVWEVMYVHDAQLKLSTKYKQNIIQRYM